MNSEEKRSKCLALIEEIPESGLDETLENLQDIKEHYEMLDNKPNGVITTEPLVKVKVDDKHISTSSLPFQKELDLGKERIKEEKWRKEYNRLILNLPETNALIKIGRASSPEGV